MFRIVIGFPLDELTFLSVYLFCCCCCKGSELEFKINIIISKKYIYISWKKNVFFYPYKYRKKQSCFQRHRLKSLDVFVGKIWTPDGEAEKHQTDVPKEAIQSCAVVVNLLSSTVPVDQQTCLPRHVCLLSQVATGEGQLAVPMERHWGPNKRRQEKENQLNLRWPLETTREDLSLYNRNNETAR